MKYILIASLLLGGCVTTKPIVDTAPDEKDQSAASYQAAEEEVDYRYEVRVGFTDYTYSNGSWNNILHTGDDFNDAYEYVAEYSSAHSDLIIYDLKTGETFGETP